MTVSYAHEPFTDFKEAKHKTAFQESLAFVNTQLGKHYPLVINGEKIETDRKIVSINPANKEEVIGYASTANQELAEKAMQSALQAFESWKNKDRSIARISFLKSRAILRGRKHEFSSYLVKEAGKPWKEADADTAEAIDFWNTTRAKS